jgi:hypothetical protein
MTKEVSEARLWWALRGARIDRVTVEVHQALQARGVPAILLKGPSIAAWLYRADELRTYGDSDFLVPRHDWDAADATLRALGFEPQIAVDHHPRFGGSFGSYPYSRGDETVDLHATLRGLDAHFDDVWAALSSGTARQPVLSTELPVLAVPARALHLALHVAHHPGAESPRRDLERGLAQLPLQIWRDAAALAARLDGLAAFGAGLRALPEGQALAATIDLAVVHTVGSALRHADVPVAEGLYDLLATQGLAARARMLIRELVPSPGFMREWSWLARRGRRGLAAAYAWRVLWLLVRLPRAAITVERALRRVH